MDHQTAVPLVVVPGPSNETKLTSGSEDALKNKVKVAAPLDRGSLLALIREQLEFYFSEDNLPRDVFLLKQIEKDKTKEGFVSLKVIAGFPKMKRLTHDLGAIREAVETSELVILSSDGLSVKRKIPLILPEDTTEKRTLYVTRLPKDCDRESLMLVFSEYGTVVRLDLPMDKKTGEHKGMAFVEFQMEEELRKALEDFTSSTKYKMVVKPFKSRNSKESSPVNGKISDTPTDDLSDEDLPSNDSDPKEKRLSGGKAHKRSSKDKEQLDGGGRNSKDKDQLVDGRRNSKDKDQLVDGRRNSKDKDQLVDGRRNSKDKDQLLDGKRKDQDGNKRSSKDKDQVFDGNKRNSQEMKENGEKRRSGEMTKRNSKELKEPTARENRYSKDAREYARQQTNRSKDSKRSSKELLNGTGREVPQVTDFMYDNSFNQARARGSRVQRNSDKMKDEETESTTLAIRAIERPKFKKETEMEKPLFVPIRNPFGPDGRGFGIGRGKLLQK